MLSNEYKKMGNAWKGRVKCLHVHVYKNGLDTR